MAHSVQQRERKCLAKKESPAVANGQKNNLLMCPDARMTDAFYALYAERQERPQHGITRRNDGTEPECVRLMSTDSHYARTITTRGRKVST